MPFLAARDDINVRRGMRGWIGDVEDIEKGEPLGEKFTPLPIIPK